MTPLQTRRRLRTPSTIAAIFCLAISVFSAFDYTKGEYCGDERAGDLRHLQPCFSKPVAHGNPAPNVSEHNESARQLRKTFAETCSAAQPAVKKKRRNSPA